MKRFLRADSPLALPGLFVAATAFYWVGNARVSLWDRDEPRYAETAKQMRRRGDYIRDQWMRDSYRAMGHASARGQFVHLYLNGLYWGIYNLTERPDAAFAAAPFGGRTSDYDARNGENILSGTSEAWEKLLAIVNNGKSDTEWFKQIDERVDLPAFADFMILNFYGGNADWDRSSNWYSARRRTPAGKFAMLPAFLELRFTRARA